MWSGEGPAVFGTQGSESYVQNQFLLLLSFSELNAIDRGSRNRSLAVVL